MRALALIAVASGVSVFFAGFAEAGQLDAEISADYFRADSKSTSPGQTAAGIPESLVANELGMRLRLNALELDDRLELRVDYRGREPLPGEIRNQSHRLLWAAELRYAILEDTLTVGVGRFSAPSALFTPVDGLRVQLRFSDLTIEPWFGRRGISTSRKNIGFSDFLPAGGLSARYRNRWLAAELAGAFARDEAVLISAGDLDDRRTFDALNLFAHVTARPIDSLFVGGNLSFIQQASYVLGPGWRDVEINSEALGLFNGLLFGDWRPLDFLSVRYEFHFQDAAVFRAGTRTEAGGTITEDTSPDFIDNTGELAANVLGYGWVRARGRFRIRDDRTEQRYRFGVDLDGLPLFGIYARGWVALETLSFKDGVAETPNLDRLLWSFAVGYDNYGIDVSAGARFLNRSEAPVSGRRSIAPGTGTQPDVSEDLAPFVLEAQRVMFLRGFYTQRLWFAGLDLERNIEDSEFRFLIQLGTFLGASW